MGILCTRKIVFENFRNLGVCNSEKPETRLDLGVVGTGGLICLIGANNEGKSNVLAGIAEWGDGQLSDKDEPTFDIGTGKPRVWVEYSISVNAMSKLKPEEALQKKEFVISSLSAAIKKTAKENFKDITGCEYGYESLQKIFAKPVEAIYGEDHKGKAIFLKLEKSEVCCGLVFTLAWDTMYIKNVCDDMHHDIKEVYGSQSGIKFKVVNSSLSGYKEQGYGVLADLRRGLERLSLEDNESLKEQGNTPRAYRKELGLDGWAQIDELPQEIGVGFPNIFSYAHQEAKLTDQHLRVAYQQIGQSAFFQTLFKILDIPLDKVTRAYEIKNKGNENRFKKTEKDICAHLKKVSERFNALYRLYEKTDVYAFNIVLGDSEVVFSISKKDHHSDDTTSKVSLDRQSTGFQKFFHFFFNFLHRDAISRGDIVLIDEPENSLSIPAQIEFRDFLKNFGREQGITFIISTHSPFMLHIDHLDEVRMVVKNTKPDTRGSWIDNDFSLKESGEVNALRKMCMALGATSNLNLATSSTDLKNRKWVFVEGIMDYNIFGAYQKIYPKKEASKLTFLPISGVGKDGAEMASKLKALLDFIKDISIDHPILLVDADKAGEAMKEAAQKNTKVRAITLKEAFMDGENPKAGFEEFCNEDIKLESLFSQEDRKQFGLQDCKHLRIAGVISSAFKNTPDLENRLSAETKKRFDTLFNFLLEGSF
ncbi:ATP-dependent nuclease [Helicobacter vulpis]|uniref:ATP-dependent nuclease n=1 Tax=Helicobacter vulpis TaxID=2316076 RepID=UPI000EB0897B|nr:AAA family ATPase [Helicobacter vulpis]